jgi:hypothetical protein
MKVLIRNKLILYASIILLLILIPYWYFSTGKNLKGKIAFTDRENVYTYEFSSGRLRKLISRDPKIQYFSLAWSPIDPLIAIEYQALNPNDYHRIYIINEITAKIEQDLQYPGGDCRKLVWSPDGSMLAFVTYDSFNFKPNHSLEVRLIIYQIKTRKTRIIDVPRMSHFYQKLSWLKNSQGGTTLYLAQLKENISPPQYNLIKLDFNSTDFDAPYTISILKELFCYHGCISLVNSRDIIKLAYGNSGLHYGLLNEELKSFTFKGWWPFRYEGWWPVADIAWATDIFSNDRLLFSTEHETDYLFFVSVTYPLYCLNPESGKYYKIKIPAQVNNFDWKL